MIKVVYSPEGRACPHIFCDVCGADITNENKDGIALIHPETNEIKFVCKPYERPCEQALSGAKWGWMELPAFAYYLTNNITPSKKAQKQHARTAETLSQF